MKEIEDYLRDRDGKFTVPEKTNKFILDSASKFLTSQGGTLDSIAKSKPFVDDILSAIKLK